MTTEQLLQFFETARTGPVLRCYDCGIIMTPLNAPPSALDGRHRFCRACNTARAAVQYRTNPRVRKARQVYKERYPERVREQQRRADAKRRSTRTQYGQDWRARHPERVALYRQWAREKAVSKSQEAAG